MSRFPVFITERKTLRKPARGRTDERRSAAMIRDPLPVDRAIRELHRPYQCGGPHRHGHEREQREPDGRLRYGGSDGGRSRGRRGRPHTRHWPGARACGSATDRTLCTRDRHYVAFHPLAPRRVSTAFTKPRANSTKRSAANPPIPLRGAGSFSWNRPGAPAGGACRDTRRELWRRARQAAAALPPALVRGSDAQSESVPRRRAA